MWHGGQLYREGWLVAPGQWYKLRQRSERGYELLTEEVSSHACAHGWEGWGAAACVCAVIPLITCTPRRLQVLFVVNHIHGLPQGPQLCLVTIWSARLQSSQAARHRPRCSWPS